MKPRIGVTLNYKYDGDNEIAMLDSRYLDYVLNAGGVPVPIIPSTEPDVIDGLLETVSGVLLTGGLDLNPGLWGETLHPKTVPLHPRRHESEFSLYRAARRRRQPIMGICLGIQLINVAQGGTLHQHIPDVDTAVVHQLPQGKATHRVRPAAGSKLYEWLDGSDVTVNSYHHQGIKQLGQGLHAAAYADNNLIEAIEDGDYPFLLGVQWHPERDPDEPVNRIIIEQFVKACRG